MIFIEATSWRSYPRCARVGGVSGTLLAGGYGKMEVDPGIVIHLCRRGKVELIKRNILMALVEDKEGGPSEHVIVNLLGGTAVREDKGERRELALLPVDLAQAGWDMEADTEAYPAEAVDHRRSPLWRPVRSRCHHRSHPQKADSQGNRGIPQGHRAGRLYKVRRRACDNAPILYGARVHRDDQQHLYNSIADPLAAWRKSWCRKSSYCRNSAERLRNDWEQRP